MVKGLKLELTRIGLEAGYAAMRQAGLAVELLETRPVRNALKTMLVKIDRNDARGIAQLMPLGWFRPVHCKSIPAQGTHALLTARVRWAGAPTPDRSTTPAERMTRY